MSQVDKKNITEQLSESKFFRNLDKKYSDRLINLGKACKYTKGDYIFLEGDDAEHFCVAVEGIIKIIKTDINGIETVIRVIIDKGELFAEAAIFDMAYYPISAVAISDCTILKIPNKDFSTMLNDPIFSRQFIQNLMNKLKYLTERIVYLTAMSVEERFFRFLINHYGVKYEYNTEMSKKDTALIIGTIPETFSRLLNKLSKKNILIWNNNTIEVINLNYFIKYIE